MSGKQKFSIHKDPSSDRLPQSHTCFNQVNVKRIDSTVINVLSSICQNMNLTINYAVYC